MSNHITEYKLPKRYNWRMGINTIINILQICMELIPIESLYVIYYSLLQLILG